MPERVRRSDSECISDSGGYQPISPTLYLKCFSKQAWTLILLIYVDSIVI